MMLPRTMVIGPSGTHRICGVHIGNGLIPLHPDIHDVSDCSAKVEVVKV
jgi:hypothetical protein